MCSSDLRAESAHFMVSPTLQSPMGLGLTAFARTEDRDGALNSFGGSALDWDGVLALVAERWPGGRPQRGMGMGGHGGHAETLTPPGEQADDPAREPRAPAAHVH